MTVRPDAATRTIAETTTAWELASSPVVGSSRRRIGGLAASSTAIERSFSSQAPSVATRTWARAVSCGERTTDW